MCKIQRNRILNLSRKITLDSIEAELISDMLFLHPTSECHGGSQALGASAVIRLGKAAYWGSWLFPGSRPHEAGRWVFLFPSCCHLAVGLELFTGRCWCWPFQTMLSVRSESMSLEELKVNYWRKYCQRHIAFWTVQFGIFSDFWLPESRNWNQF